MTIKEKFKKKYKINLSDAALQEIVEWVDEWRVKEAKPYNDTYNKKALFAAQLGYKNLAEAYGALTKRVFDKKYQDHL